MKNKKYLIFILSFILLFSINTVVLAEEYIPHEILGEPTVCESETTTKYELVQSINNTSNELIINTQKDRTKEEIVEKFKEAKTTVANDTAFIQKPVINGPNYSGGILSELAKNDFLKTLNFFRYMAGAPNVEINETYMEDNAKGAVLLSASDFAHVPEKPADMSNEFYNSALNGTRFPSNSGYSVSGNVSAGASLIDSIKGYIDETSNINKDSVGHRLSLLNPRAVKTSFGYSVGDSDIKTGGRYGQYTAVTMYHNYKGSSTGKYYTWPPAGFCPIEVTEAGELWSITLDQNYSYDVSNMKIELVHNNITYPVKTKIYSTATYNSFYFALPVELENLLTSGVTYSAGNVVTVNILNGIKNENDELVDIKYDIEFFVAEEIPVENFTLYQRKTTATDEYYWTFSSLNGFVGEQIELYVMYTPYNTTQTELKVEFSNPEIASYDKTTKLFKLNKAGNTSCTVSSVNNPNISKTFNINVKNWANVSYSTHVQNIGWQEYVKNGQMAGTSGKGLRVEGIKIYVDSNLTGSIEYSSNIEQIGWQDYVSSDMLSGTNGRSLKLEAIKINLTGTMAKVYDVYYRVHAQNAGWLGWAKNGEEAGTAGYGFRLEGIEIKLVEKGNKAPGSTTNCFISKNK